MLFVFPMWDSESQRIGKQRCTPTGYALHAIAEVLGLIGGLSLLGVAVFLVYRGIMGNFSKPLFWLLVAPLGMGIFAETLFQISWLLAARRKFKYDYENRAASWVEDGKLVTYACEPDRPPEHICEGRVRPTKNAQR